MKKMNKEKQDTEKLYLHKYLAECVLAIFSNRPEVLKVLEIASKYISIIEELKTRVSALEFNADRLALESEEVYLVFVDGKLLSSKCQVEADIYRDQFEVNFPDSTPNDDSEKTIRVVKLKFAVCKEGYPQTEEAKNGNNTR